MKLINKLIHKPIDPSKVGGDTARGAVVPHTTPTVSTYPWLKDQGSRPWLKGNVQLIVLDFAAFGLVLANRS